MTTTAPQAARLKKGLTGTTCPDHDSDCRQTTDTGLEPRKAQADDSATLAEFLRPPHVLPRLWRTVWGSRKAGRTLSPVVPTPHGSAALIGTGARRFKPPLRSFTMRNLSPHVRFTVYRILRHFAGPAVAFRLAFGRAAA